MNKYILTFDPSRFMSIPRSVEAYIDAQSSISGWSSPFLGCFIIKSDKTAREMIDVLDPFFDRKGYLIAKIETKGDVLNGRAIGAVWDFVHDKISLTDR